MDEEIRRPDLKHADAGTQARGGMKSIFEVLDGPQKIAIRFNRATVSLQPVLDAAAAAVKISLSLQPMLDEAAAAVAKISLSLQPMLDAAAAVAEKILPPLRFWLALNDSGWLPHYTTPFDCVARCGGDADEVRDLLSRHYQERWPEVRREIEARLMQYDIDKEAKKMFCEALDNHGGRSLSQCL